MSKHALSATDKKVLHALAPYATVASIVLDAWGSVSESSVHTARSLVSLSQLGLTEEEKVLVILNAGVSMDILARKGEGYEIVREMHSKFKQWAYALKVMSFYVSDIHQDSTVSKVILTKPAKPSQLEKKLSDKGWKTFEIEPTMHAFHGMANATIKRLVIMTPFFDKTGAEWVKEIFSMTKEGVQRILILRSLEHNKDWNDYPSGYDLISGWLKDHQVAVYNYSVKKAEGGGRETFHAKVVLADSRIAYIGSSNMTAASSYSMEMGVKITGRSAADVAVIVESVISVATLWRKI